MSDVKFAGDLPTRSLALAIKPLVAPLLFATSPTFVGLERVPSPGERPLLFVGNHTTYGMLDIWALFLTLLEEKDILLRSLGDHVHFQVPVWGPLLTSFGAVDGTRANCGALLSAGESVLVFPGGAREVSKRKGEKYQLIWKDRVGFVKMALAHGATIVPFAAVGVEDQFDVALDAGDLFASPAGPLLRRLGIREEAVPPLPKPVGDRLLPKAERLYFHFGTPIPTHAFAGRQDDEALCRRVRADVRTAVEEGIAALRAMQATDVERHLVPRVQHRAKRAARSLVETVKTLRPPNPRGPRR